MTLLRQSSGSSSRFGRPGSRVKRRADVFQQRRADDAAASPDPRHGFEVEVILIFVRRSRQKRHALRVGEDHARHKARGAVA